MGRRRRKKSQSKQWENVLRWLKEAKREIEEWRKESSSLENSGDN